MRRLLMGGLTMAAALALGPTPPRAAPAPATVRFVYDWTAADFELAPITAAIARGYYKDAGIDLKVIFPPDAQSTPRMLAAGAGDVGFEGTTDIVFAAAQGIPVVSIAAYTQGNDWCLVGRPGETIKLDALKGKSIAIFTDSWTKAMMPFVLRAAHLQDSDVKLVVATDDDIAMLLAGRVDIATNTSNYAVAQVQSAVQKKPTLVCAAAFGAPDSPVWAYTASASWLKANPDLARKFLAATKKGMEYAADHPVEAIDMLHKQYPDSGDTAYSLDGWRETIPMLKGSNGYLNQTPAQWQALAGALKDTGQIPAVLPMEKYYTDAYLPQ